MSQTCNRCGERTDENIRVDLPFDVSFDICGDEVRASFIYVCSDCEDEFHDLVQKWLDGEKDE